MIDINNPIRNNIHFLLHIYEHNFNSLKLKEYYSELFSKIETSDNEYLKMDASLDLIELRMNINEKIKLIKMQETNKDYFQLLYAIEILFYLIECYKNKENKKFLYEAIHRYESTFN